MFVFEGMYTFLLILGPYVRVNLSSSEANLDLLRDSYHSFILVWATFSFKKLGFYFLSLVYMGVLPMVLCVWVYSVYHVCPEPTNTGKGFWIP